MIEKIIVLVLITFLSGFALNLADKAQFEYFPEKYIAYFIGVIHTLLIIYILK